jgi:predicted nucleic acid-binding protein
MEKQLISMYLVDTNIWLERLLDQEKSNEAGEFLATVPSTEIFMTDFSLHSIAIILTKLKKSSILSSFVHDVFVIGGVRLVHLDATDFPHILDAANQYSLDFDDAYHYSASRKHDLELVSFDSDFDKTDRHRRTLRQILEQAQHTHKRRKQDNS